MTGISIFRCSKNVKNYSFPILKIAMCCLLIVLMIGGGSALKVSSLLGKIAIGILCITILALSVLCIYIAFAEMLLLYERKEKKKNYFEKAIIQSKNLPAHCVFSLLEDNDIIEVLIASDNCIFTVMASSDIRPGSSVFFDKRYHIGDRAYTEFVDFKEAITPYAIGGEFCVIEIDGVPANRYFSTGDGLSEP